MRGKRISPAPWISVNDRLPETVMKAFKLVPVLATDGKEVARAVYVRKHTISTDDLSFDGDAEFDEESDSGYWPAGWYEWNRYEETHWLIEAQITHWMPIPPQPEVKS